MTTFENDIYRVIASSFGIRGADIAERLNVDKKLVNSTLASSAALKAVVTQDSTYRWHVIATKSHSTVGNTSVKRATSSPDQELQAICNYYLSCIALESSSSVSQFLISNYSCAYAVLNSLGIDPEADEQALQLLNTINRDRTKKAYLGYPSRIYTVYGKGGVRYQKIAPVFLFPVEYAGGKIEISWLPSVNLEILKGYSDNGNDSLANELVQLENELGMDNPDEDIEIDELVYRIREIRQWDWKEKIDPYSIPCAADLRNLPNGIYNRPIIIEAEREKYTQGLESELMALSNMSEEDYRGTALHAWIKGDFSTTQSVDIKPLLEVLPMNSEQAQAVETALRSDLTIVTGPPGTGKSQVVTNLLVNIAWNGKSALFSSKNNKAVDVVDMRVNGLCKRPVLLRMGSNQYAGRLAEIIEGMLNVKPSPSAKQDLEFYLQEYNKRIAQASKLQAAKSDVISRRNQLDSSEQTYCQYRHMIDWCFDIIEPSLKGKVKSAIEEYASAYQRSIKKNNSFFARLFWAGVGPKREADRKSKELAYNLYAEKYKLARASSGQSPEETHELVSAAEEFENAINAALTYKHALQAFRNITPLEMLDKSLAENKISMADIAFKLWNSWLISQSVTFSAAERSSMANFIATMKLAVDINLLNEPDLRNQYAQMTRRMTRYLQCWAVTSLSAKSRVPFTAGMFDYIIIDEASQCDIASILPLLYRAKRAVIIGDPKQLSHISQLSGKQDLALLRKYKVPASWSYSANSLYALAASKVNDDTIVQLKDHFRSCADIIEFSNDTFYDGSLRTATKYASLKPPCGEKPGIRWIDTKGKTVRPSNGSAYNEEEANAIVSELKRLIDNGYKGTIGVTTPFRKQAERIRDLLENKHPKLYEQLRIYHEFLVDTVHKFQGDERDVMIFSTVITHTTPTSTIGFLCNTGNLFNVAITRARAVLIVVGDYNYCSNCSVDYLLKFAKYYSQIAAGEHHKNSCIQVPDEREYPQVSNPEQVSDWEKTLYTALFDAGIKTIPQYPAERYKLDLAIIHTNGRKLDIEVDGEMYHRQWNGELCYRDQIRNRRLFELGWDVKRFWVYQIRDDISWCVKQIQGWYNSN